MCKVVYLACNQWKDASKSIGERCGNGRAMMCANACIDHVHAGCRHGSRSGIANPVHDPMGLDGGRRCEDDPARSRFRGKSRNSASREYAGRACRACTHGQVRQAGPGGPKRGISGGDPRPTRRYSRVGLSHFRRGRENGPPAPSPESLEFCAAAENAEGPKTGPPKMQNMPQSPRQSKTVPFQVPEAIEGRVIPICKSDRCEEMHLDRFCAAIMAERDFLLSFL